MYNLNFYFMVATRYHGSGSFCKELGNDPYWLSVAQKRWHSKETFEAYSHGRAIQELIEECNQSSMPPAKRKKRTDEIRANLRAKLNKLLGNVVTISWLSKETITDSAYDLNL